MQEFRQHVSGHDILLSVVKPDFFVCLGRKSGFKCCEGKLLARKDILREYLGNDIILQVEALYALQEIYAKYNKPKGMYWPYEPCYY